MHYIHLQITTTGINKQTKSDIIQPRLQFLECWHRFYHKSQNFPINLCDSWLCFLFSVLTLGWPMLRCFKNVPWSLISLKRHRVYKGQSKRWDIRSSIFSCFTYPGTPIFFSSPHLMLIIISLMNYQFHNDKNGHHKEFV